MAFGEPFAGYPIGHIRSEYICQYARHLGYQHISRAAVFEAKHPSYAAGKPEYVHIPRRIIREHTAVIEVRQSVPGKVIAPCHKAVYVRTVPIKYQRQQAAHEKRQHEQHADIDAFPIGLRLFEYALPVAYGANHAT